MTNIAHASLTGSELHEPKGIETAQLGEVYVADGVGSGNWASVGTSSFTGMIADFPSPVAPIGWLECDGSDISSSTYSALYAVMTLQMNGTRSSGSSIITSLSSTSNMKAGYYVFGTGISAGTTIVSVDSSSQITLSSTASSSGTANLIISPWYLNTGTIRLPDLTSVGRFRRSRSSSTSVGQVQDSQNLAHTHGVSGSTATDTHTHSFSGTTGYMDQNAIHTHTENYFSAANVSNRADSYGSNSGFNAATTTGPANTDHRHSFSGTTGANTHSHTVSLTSASSGGTEARPSSIVLMTCIKI